MGDDQAPTDAREDIMRGVHTVLSDEGYHGLTTQRVADAAGCSQSLVHYHYATKTDLVVAFLEWVLEGEREWLDTLADGSPEERLHRFVDVQLSIPRDDEHGRFNVAFLELTAAAARNDPYAAVLREFSALLQDVLVRILRDGIDAGEFRDADPEPTARFLRYALHGAVVESLTHGIDHAKTETRVAAHRYIEQVILAEPT